MGRRDVVRGRSPLQSRTPPDARLASRGRGRRHPRDGPEHEQRSGRVHEAKDKLLDCVDGWVSVTERLMSEPWDLVFVVFTSSDTAQHFFWTPDGQKVVERVYEEQDRATARLVEKARSADPGTNVM